MPSFPLNIIRDYFGDQFLTIKEGGCPGGVAFQVGGLGTLSAHVCIPGFPVPASEAQRLSARLPGVPGCSGTLQTPGPVASSCSQSDGVSGNLCRPGGQTDLLCNMRAVNWKTAGRP